MRLRCTRRSGPAEAGRKFPSSIITTAIQGIASNPVGPALSGLRTFNAHTDAELDAIPWASLTAGDVVNIYYKSTPYVVKFGLSAIGTALNKVIINGVTDASGNRPIITGANARTASGSMPGGAANVFGTDPSEQALGTIVVKRKPNTSTNPAWIVIQNLDVTGAGNGQAFLNANGSANSYGFAGAIWLQPSSDIEIKNCLLRDSSHGIFTQSKQGGDNEQCVRLRIRYNRVTGNGTAGTDREHGCYIQGYNSIIEGNYFGPLVTNASGSSLKTRGGNEVIRYNYIEASGRAMDLVGADGYMDGMVLMTDYAKTYVYGNVIVNDSALGQISWRPIHFGGDDAGEQIPSLSASASPANYRKNLYFWSNTFYCAGSSSAQQYFIDLSFPDITCDYWNNVAVFTGSSTTCLLTNAGTLNMRGKNILRSASTVADRSPDTLVANATVNRVGSLLTTDPAFVSSTFYDFTPGAGSPALDVATAAPSGLPAGIDTSYPVEFSPCYRSNGLVPRVAVGAPDLGAIERDPTAPPPSGPVAAINPSIAEYGVVGGVLNCSDGSWVFSPTSIAKQWQWFNGSAWVDISGQTGNSITLTSGQIGTVRCKVTRSNVTGAGVAYSNTVLVTAVGPVLPVQKAYGYDNYPVNNGGAGATFPSPPTVGNTLAAFFAGASSTGSNNVTDNFGNTWTKRRSIQTGAGVYTELYTCVVAAGKTGAGFRVFGASTNQWASSIEAVEVPGAYATSVASTGSTTSQDETVNLPADQANRLILAAASAGGTIYSHNTYPAFSSGFTLDRGYGDDTIPTTVAYVHGITTGTSTPIHVTSGNYGLAVIAATFQ